MTCDATHPRPFCGCTPNLPPHLEPEPTLPLEDA